MQIITGKTDTAHVRSEDDRALHAGTFGTGAYILNVGSRLAASIETANNIVIADGELMFQGTHARIRYGETETCIIENGTTGYNRIDLIVARYTQSAGLEQVELVVIKGEATAGEPAPPAYTTGNILEGATLAEIPLYAVRIAGVNVISVTSQLPVIVTTMDGIYTKADIDGKVAILNQKIANEAAELDQRIASDVSLLNARDTQLSNDITQVQTEYDAADTALRQKTEELDAKIDMVNALIRQDYAAQDAILQQSITNLASVTDTAIGNLQKQIDNLKK